MESKILDKIKKLIAKQKSAEELGSVQEAEAFAIKVQELLNKHNISLKDISFEELKDNIIQEILDCKIPSVSYTLGYNIFYPIAKWNWCRVYTFTSESSKMCVVGTPENIEVCKMIYEIVLPIFLKEGKRKYKSSNQQGGLDTYLREFLRGCAKGLDLKFKSEREAFEVKNIRCTTLIVRNDKAIVEYVETKFKMGKGRAQSYKRNDAYYEGVQTGKNVEINKKLDE